MQSAFHKRLIVHNFFIHKRKFTKSAIVDVNIKNPNGRKKNLSIYRLQKPNKFITQINFKTRFEIIYR